MKKLNLTIDDESREYNIPDNWSEVTVSTLQKLGQYQLDDMTEIEQSVKTISTLLGIDEDDVMMIPIDEFHKISDEVSFLNSDIESNPKDEIELNGETYYVKKDYSKLTTGEVVSIDTIMKKYDQNLMPAMAELLCIFLRKKKPNGKLEGFKNSFMDRAELFGDINVAEVYDLFINFSTTSDT